MTMIILGTAGIASFEPHVFVGAVLPFLGGFALGNLDPELREFFSKAVQTLIPFFAFALGNTIDLTVIAQTGLLGILLGVAVIIVSGIPLIIADKLIGGGDGHCRNCRFQFRRGRGSDTCADCRNGACV